MRKQCVGIMGGTFDPIHLGHLLTAEAVRDALGLDEILFVPAAVPPHKQGKDIVLPRQPIRISGFRISSCIGRAPPIRWTPWTH